MNGSCVAAREGRQAELPGRKQRRERKAREATLLIAVGIVVEASLSFVGLGVEPPAPSWGNMLADARQFIYSGAWWTYVFPGLAISITVIGFNLLGDALRDQLDPRTRLEMGL